MAYFACSGRRFSFKQVYIIVSSPNYLQEDTRVLNIICRKAKLTFKRCFSNNIGNCYLLGNVFVYMVI